MNCRIYIYQTVKKINADRAALYSGQRPDVAKLIVEGQGRPYLGNPNADIVIVEFSDFTCPYCKENEPVIKAIMAKYSKQVKFIYRNLLLHQDSGQLALASLCAGEQQKNGVSLFWPMHDQLFNLQGKIGDGDLTKIAVALGANEKTFQNCLDTQKYAGILNDDMSSANTIGITGSPAWLINNYKIDGEVTQEEMESMIQELLKNGPGLEAPTSNATSSQQ